LEEEQTDTNPGGEEKYERFVVLFTHEEPALRAFVRSLLPSWHDVDEVMQQTSIVIWKKFDQFKPGTSFMRWACVIARFEVLKYRRSKARERLVFREDLCELLAEEAMDSAEALQKERQALYECMQKLSDTDRALVGAAYAHGTSIKEVAESIGHSATAFYKKLHRIRMGLLGCIQRQLVEEGT
jgi:RNA polymerase sigma-70 factor (ECF subfamily)